MQTSNVWWAKPLPQTSRPPHNPTHGGRQGTHHRARARVRDNNSHRYKTWSTSVRFRLSPSKKCDLCMATHTRVYTHKEIQKNSGMQNSQYTLGCYSTEDCSNHSSTNVKLKSNKLFWRFWEHKHHNIFTKTKTHTQLLTSKLLAYFEYTGITCNMHGPHSNKMLQYTEKHNHLKFHTH